MHFYDLKFFIFFVEIICSSKFAFCGESVRFSDGVQRQDPSAIFLRSESTSNFDTKRTSYFPRFLRKREIQTPSNETLRRTAAGDNAPKDELALSLDTGSEVANKTVKKQLKKQDDGTDVLQTPPIQVKNSTIPVEKPAGADHSLPDPGAKMRGVIVFGSLGLLSFIYLAYKIYRKRRRGEEGSRRGDLQQFKYGVLTSAEADDRLEMAHLPLHLQSEDEETEIFDLERRNLSDRREITQKETEVEAVDDDLLDLREPNDHFVKIL